MNLVILNRKHKTSQSTGTVCNWETVKASSISQLSVRKKTHDILHSLAGEVDGWLFDFWWIGRVAEIKTDVSAVYRDTVNCHYTPNHFFASCCVLILLFSNNSYLLSLSPLTWQNSWILPLPSLLYIVIHKCWFMQIAMLDAHVAFRIDWGSSSYTCE